MRNLILDIQREIRQYAYFEPEVDPKNIPEQNCFVFSLVLSVSYDAISHAYFGNVGGIVLIS